MFIDDVQYVEHQYEFNLFECFNTLREIIYTSIQEYICAYTHKVYLDSTYLTTIVMCCSCCLSRIFVWITPVQFLFIAGDACCCCCCCCCCYDIIIHIFITSMTIISNVVICTIIIAHISIITSGEYHLCIIDEDIGDGCYCCCF